MAAERNNKLRIQTLIFGHCAICRSNVTLKIFVLTLFVILRHCFIVLSSQLGPFRKLVLRADVIHLPIQTDDFGAKFGL